MPRAWTTKPTRRTRKGRDAHARRRVTSSRALAAHAGERRRPPGAGDRAEHPEREQEGDEDPHREVAGPAVAEGLDDGGCARAGEQDAQRQRGHPPGHQGRPLVRVVGDLGRLGDVGHLEAAVRRGRQQEGHGHPCRGLTRGSARSGEDQHEQRRKGEPAGQHPWPAGAPTALRAVRPAADPRVEDDVPRLGQEHHQAGDTGGDPEHVGQVVEEQQAGHRAEGRRPDGAHGVADVGAPGEPGGW